MFSNWDPPHGSHLGFFLCSREISIKNMASSHNSLLCTINAMVKGHHVYRTSFPVNTCLDCTPEPGNHHSNTAVSIYRASTTVGHIPEGLCQVVFKLLTEKNSGLLSLVSSLSLPGVLLREYGLQVVVWRHLVNTCCGDIRNTKGRYMLK